MKIKKAFKYRLYPTGNQQAVLTVQFGHARFVYNWALARRKTHYKETGKGLSVFAINKEITALKQDPETCWLKEADSQVLQQKAKDLDTAYKNFFAKRAGYPHFKNKKSVQSIRYPQRFRIAGNKIYLPKVGWVKVIQHRPIEGKPKNCTVSKTKSGKYFVSIQCEVDIPDPVFTGSRTGIDLGLADFVTTSEGEKVAPPRYLRQAERKLKRLQRQLSRKKRGSNGRRKARLRLARQAERVANQRRDFQHKLSSRLVANNRLLCFENLNIAGMLKNHCLAKSIADAGWAEFVRQCEYKGGWYGCYVEKVGRFFPSSKLCNACGEKHQYLKLSDRSWVCDGCGAIHDRDKNAADNILQEGLRLINTVGATGINAGGENVRPGLAFAIPAVSAKPEAHPL